MHIADKFPGGTPSRRPLFLGFLHILGKLAFKRKAHLGIVCALGGVTAE